jgi:transcriptional regulator with XRE-family HTH domain
MASKSRSKRTPAALQRSLRTVGENVGTWRRLRGLTQAQVADRAGVATDTVKRLEHGDGGVSTENLFRVMRALGALDPLLRASDPYETDIGRLRSEEVLPRRVRSRSLKEGDRG